MRIYFSVLLVLFTVAISCAGETALAKRAAVARKIAKEGNAATVALYCKRGTSEGFYGTGVVISPDGYILTSTTVVPKGAKEIEVLFTTYVKRKATIVALDEKLEATLLKVDSDGLKYVPVCPELPNVGERAYTFGNALNMIKLGQSSSFSVGIISGLYHVKSADTQSTYEGIALETDAAINPGQDGGPILNSRGQLIGIISLSYSESRWQGTAVPVAMILKKLEPFVKGTIKPDTEPRFDATIGGAASENPFAIQAKKLSKFLVPITIKRKYDTPDFERVSWAEYVKTDKTWKKLTPIQRMQREREFRAADRAMGANQQLRRPNHPVTGVVVSPDGLIVTSLFNISEDKAFVRRKDGKIDKRRFKTSMRELLTYSKTEYKSVTNSIESVTIQLPDGSHAKATIHARHIPLDLAILKVDVKGLPYLDLKKLQGNPELGERIGLIGLVKDNDKHSFTLNGGMISATGRMRETCFQMSALNNYGNSGGLVFNAEGKALGFATAPLLPNPFLGQVLPMQALATWRRAPNSGIGFATQVTNLLKDIDKLAMGESITSISGPFVGIGPDQGRILEDSVYVGMIVKDSPAEKAMLKKGDVILAINDESVKSWKHLNVVLAKHKTGETVKLKVKRRGGLRYLTLADNKKISAPSEFHRLFNTLKDGEVFSGKMTRTSDIFTVDLTLVDRRAIEKKLEKEAKEKEAKEKEAKEKEKLEKEAKEKLEKEKAAKKEVPEKKVPSENPPVEKSPIKETSEKKMPEKETPKKELPKSKEEKAAPIQLK